MTELLPRKSVTVFRHMMGDTNYQPPPMPYLEINQSHKDWQWTYQATRFLLGLSKLSPVQIRLKHFLEQHGVEIVLSEYLDQSLKWLQVARELGIEFFAHAHGYDISRKLRDPEMCRQYLQLDAADGIITMSEYSRSRLIGIGLDGSKIHVIPYGVDVSALPVQHMEKKIIRCLAVGRMVAKKAPLLLIEAFHRALSVFSNLHLDYVGDGSLFEDVKKYISINGIEHKVTLHGSQPNEVVQTMMKEADIFLQHSRTDPETGDEEGMPVAILEAMGNGLPVISTKHAGIPEAVLHGETGFLSNEGDTETMALNIVQLSKNCNLRRNFGQAGWKRVMKYFTWEREKSDLLELFGLK